MGVTHEFEHKIIVNQRISVANQGISSDMQYALNETRVAAHDSAIRDSIINNDATRVATELSNFAKKYNLGTMVAVNSQGIALARVSSKSKGDLVFLTTPWGQEAAQGREVVMVGEGRNFPLIINSAVPIVNDDIILGAVFGGYILDNTYATEFKKKYLKPVEQVAFYSIKDGVYGTSFNDPAIERIFKSLFSVGSNAIQGEKVGRIAGHFKIGNTIFHVVNARFADLTGPKVGGVFVLIPAHTNAPPTVAGLAGMIFLIFLSFHVRKKHKTKWIKIIILFVALFLTVGTVVASVWSVRGFLYRNPPPYTIYNSTMELYPNSNIFSGLTQQKIDIQITTGGEEINAAQASIKYDPTQVQIEEIVMDNSFCDQQFIIEKTIDNKNGTATIVCGNAGGFLADRAILAELIMQPLRLGEATLQFTEDTSVLAYDGLGTNVLRTVTNGSYQFVNSFISSADNAVALFSQSHPNPTRWYNNKNVRITWINSEPYEDFAYSLDQNPNTVPDGKKISDKTSIDLRVESDGVYYFHLTSLKSSRVKRTAHLKILIDTTPPILPEIQVSASEINIAEVLRLNFLSHGDATSGLQKNFYVQFDNGLWLPTLPQMNIPFFETGGHSISLRVFDNAGNYSDTNSEIYVK